MWRRCAPPKAPTKHPRLSDFKTKPRIILRIALRIVLLCGCHSLCDRLFDRCPSTRTLHSVSVQIYTPLTLLLEIQKLRRCRLAAHLLSSTHLITLLIAHLSGKVPRDAAIISLLGNCELRHLAFAGISLLFRLEIAAVLL